MISTTRAAAVRELLVATRIRRERVTGRHREQKRGGSPKGAELIAAQWASQRNVLQIAFRLDWTKHAKAPFKRNDAMLAVLPIGVIVFPGNGIRANVASKARQLGIAVWQFDGGT